MNNVQPWYKCPVKVNIITERDRRYFLFYFQNISNKISSSFTASPPNAPPPFLPFHGCCPSSTSSVEEPPRPQSSFSISNTTPWIDRRGNQHSTTPFHRLSRKILLFFFPLLLHQDSNLLLSLSACAKKKKKILEFLWVISGNLGCRHAPFSLSVSACLCVCRHLRSSDS